MMYAIAEDNYVWQTSYSISFFTMSRDEYANFVEDTIQLVIQQFAEKN